MSLHLALVWIISILAATFIITFVLELSTHDGLLTQSIWEHYKVNLWQILIAFGWISGIAAIIGVMRTFYDGARMNYNFLIEFYERLLEFYYQRLPQMKLVYTNKLVDPMEVNSREDVLHLEFPTEPQQQPMQLQQQPMQLQQQQQQPMQLQQQQQQPMQLQQQQQQPMQLQQQQPMQNVLHIEEPEQPSRRQQPYRTRRRSVY